MLDLAALYRAHIGVLRDAYATVLASHHLDALVIAAGSAALKNQFDDQHWSLSTNPTFGHWLPLPEPDAVVVIVAGARPRLIRVVTDDYWESLPRCESEHFWSEFEIATVRSRTAIADHLPTGKVAVIATTDLPFAPPGPVNPPALVAACEQVRVHKTAYEIECLAEATRRAVAGHLAAAKFFAIAEPSELDLHLTYLATTGQDDSDTPYKNIVARGAHAAVLHWIAYDRQRNGGPDSLLVDAGARYLGYASDITRTWVRGTSAGAERFAALIAAMDQLQQQVCGEIAVGMAYEALHDRCHQLLATVLVDHGIATGSASALLELGVTRQLFPHGLGHSLGLQVHDVGMKLRPPRPDNRYLRNTSTIEVGQVFTIEPGCYWIDALLEPMRTDHRKDLLDWKVVELLRPFGGIRIEDNVLVTGSGIRNFTREARLSSVA